VPVQARTREGGRPSNVIGLSVHLPGEPCRDDADWFRRTVAHAASAGYVVLAHISFLNGADFQFDYGIGSFGRQESGERPFPPLPPMHTCTLLTDRINLRAMYGAAGAPSAWTSVAQPAPGNRRLDAGAALTLTGPDGERRLTRDARKPEYYNALLGGQPPFTHGARLPLFAARGAYTITGAGGADVGPFSAAFDVPAPVVWSNRARVSEVQRASGVTVEWKPSRKQDVMLIVAAAADYRSGDAALCLCTAPAAERRFTVAPLALSALPATGAVQGPDPSYLLLLEMPAEPPARIVASGLDEAFAAYISASGRLVTFR
jgi:hypothetical protein